MKYINRLNKTHTVHCMYNLEITIITMVCYVVKKFKNKQNNHILNLQIK